MSTLLTAPPETPVSVDPDRRFELVDGVEVELPSMSVEANALASRLARRVGNYVDQKELGEAFAEIKIKLPRPRNNHRIPGVIFVPYSRWPKGKAFPRDDAWHIKPSLCIEVVSPSDISENVLEKVSEYLRAGIDQVGSFIRLHNESMST